MRIAGAPRPLLFCLALLGSIGVVFIQLLVAAPGPGTTLGQGFQTVTKGEIKVIASLDKGVPEQDLTALVYIANAGERPITIPRVKIAAEAIRSDGKKTVQASLRVYTGAQYENMLLQRNSPPAPGSPVSADDASRPVPTAVPRAKPPTGHVPGLGWVQTGGQTGPPTPWIGVYKPAPAAVPPPGESGASPRQKKDDWFLTAQTLDPVQYYGGEVHIKGPRKPADAYRITIEAAGKTFEFRFQSEQRGVENDPSP